MFIPIYDDNELRSIRFSYVTYGLILVNVLVFMFLQGGINIDPQNGFAVRLNEILTASFAIIPTEFLGQSLPSNVPIPSNQLPIPEGLTAISYMFLHGGWLHLGSNMLFLWVFGDNVEDALGHFRFLLFYILCGVAAGLLQIYLTPAPHSILIGASGAVAGVIAAYMMLYPHVWLWVLALGRIPVYLKAYWIILAWISMQLLSAFSLTGNMGNVAWWAHIGGFFAGAILIVFMRQPGYELFSKNLKVT